MQPYKQTAISIEILQYLYTLQTFGNDLLKKLIPFFNVPSWKTFFHHTNNLYKNIGFIIEKESNGEIAFLATLLHQNNGKISVLVYRIYPHTDQHQRYNIVAPWLPFYIGFPPFWDPPFWLLAHPPVKPFVPILQPLNATTILPTLL